MARLNHHDAEWLEAMTKGDSSAFCLLYDKYAPLLLGVIRSTVNDDKTAEAILESVFTSLILGKYRYDTSQGRVFTWLLGITRKLTAEYGASKKGTKAGIQGHDNLVYNGAGSESAPAVMLVLFKGCSYDEAAKTLGLPTHELKNVIRNEINLLRDLS